MDAQLALTLATGAVHTPTSANPANLDTVSILCPTLAITVQLTVNNVPPTQHVPPAAKDLPLDTTAPLAENVQSHVHSAILITSLNVFHVHGEWNLLTELVLRALPTALLAQEPLVIPALEDISSVQATLVYLTANFPVQLVLTGNLQIALSAKQVQL